MTRIKVKGVKVLDYKPKENLASLEVEFIKDNKDNNIVKDLVLKHPLTLVKTLFLAVKSKDRVIFDEVVSDPLEALEKYAPILIEKEDEVEEKMSNFLTDLCQMAKILKSNTDSKKHMRLINQFKTSKLELIPTDKKQQEKRDPSYLKMLRRNI